MAAGTGYESGPGMKEILALVNLAIIFGIVYFAGRKGIIASLKTRSEDVRKKLFESKEELEKATKQLNEVRAQLEDFEATKTSMLENTKKDAESLGAKILEEATVSASKILEEAKLAAANEVRGAASNLKADLIRETMAEASQILANNKDKQATLHKQLFETMNLDIKGAQN